MARILTDAEVFGSGQVLSDDEVFGKQHAGSPAPIGAEAFGGLLRDELKNADWFTRNLAGFGTAASDLWERGKQLVGHGDKQAIEANQIIADEAPVGAMLGQAAITAVPFGLAGNSVKAAGAIGAGIGLSRPVGGEQTLSNIASGTAKNVAASTLLSAAGQFGANKVGGWIANKAEQKIADAISKPINKTLAEANDLGLVVPPSAVTPSLFNRTMGSIAGKTNALQAASNKNAQVVDATLKEVAGVLPEESLTNAALKAARDRFYTGGYKPIAEIRDIPADEVFVQGLIDKVLPKNASGAIENPAKAEIVKMTDRLANQGRWTGQQLLDDIRMLRKEAKANFNSASRAGGDQIKTELASAQWQAVKQLEDLAERHLPPGVVEKFRAARKGMAQNHLVDDALIRGGGTLDARVIGRKYQHGAPLDGPLETIGAFANNFPKAMQPYRHIEGPAVNQLMTYLKAGAGAAMGGAGLASGNPVLAAAGAALPFVAPGLARARMLSSGAQEAMLNDLMQLGLPVRTANRLIKYLPATGAVAGSNAFSKDGPL